MLQLVPLFTLLAVALCAPEKMLEHGHVDNDLDSNSDAPVHLHEVTEDRIQKRSPAYDFGLGKRAYSYVSEYKRLPVYNFGLGKKRAMKDYSFGLGKRSVDVGDSWDMDQDEEQILADLLERYEQNGGEMESKRARPYSFGLGKRYADESTDPEKRARMYEFGLGKRTPHYNFGLGKRLPSRAYSFGLGKRRAYSFGLGKRERDLNRFNFGLGKRSVDETAYDDDDVEVDSEA